MEINFKGKRALVTGAGSGIGRALALKLAQCGATVLAIDLSSTALETLKQEIPNGEFAAVDISNWEATNTTLRKLLPIDLLVNNAGIAFTDPLESITQEQCDRIFAVNVKALINITKTVISDMVARKSPGAIVNISSQASKAALLNHSLYCATKGAVDAFTRAVALEFGPCNIRINCVNPTVVMTDLGRKIWSDPKMGGPMLAKIPLNRFAEIEDVVDGVLFLLSDKAQMITGSCVPIDGGFLAC
ncbi:L-xylulose reductase [Tribolium castaneum]|uniref:L-xylulose reductase-like Protein n=1 Tax=Tribolium castaneum TaxID=7070 RepID=D6WVW0_TRICA|nr:PREDICTED: L-xylulose reductase [Tribolium castaneum]EFA08233.1 L-xylulose reductase-like Protein [Tribolium castaneum]|eukprot:XP_971043.1 PREDICTED: L-xylulose reductase [Tribolium castaneum]